MRALAADRAVRQAADRALCEESIDPDSLKALRAATRGGYPLVSEAFKSSLELRTGLRMERGKPGPRGAVRKKALAKAVTKITTLTPN